MAHQLHTKSPLSLHAFTMKKTPCQITSTSLKFKALIQAYISQALSYSKLLFIELLNTKDGTINYIIKLRSKSKKNKIFSSIRVCCTRPSTYVMPMPHETMHEYYDSTWDSTVLGDESNGGGDDIVEASAISGYLQWLEEKEKDINNGASESIDRLAEKFIARCHEKFRLEKQESYRRYQEMLARSL